MNTNAELNQIAAVDLDPIKAKLMEQDGEGWTQQRADAVEVEYRRFLCLAKLYPDEETAPLVDVDIFWHYHILDTMKYAVDCQQIFGYFLHHSPFSGPRSAADEANHEMMGARMHELYRATFGEPGNTQRERLADAAWCQLSTANSQAAAATSAWCQLGAGKSAWCQLGGAKSAWCQLTTPRTAAPQAATAQSAWCQLTAPTSAWCQLGTPKSGALRQVAAWPQSGAQNSSVYSRAPVLAQVA